MKKNALRLPAIVIFSLITLYSCVMVPLLEYIVTDGVLSETVLYLIVDLLWMHLETVASIALLTFVVFGIYAYRLSGAKQVLLLTAGALLFKYFAAIVAVSIEYGSLDLTGGLNSYLVSFLIELFILALIAFLGARMITPRQVLYEEKKAAAKKLNREFREKPLFPFQKKFSLKNPIQRLIFIGIIVVVLGRIAADIPITFQFGIEDNLDIIVALIEWLILIILPAIYSYFLSLLFFKLCVKQQQKSEETAENDAEDASDSKDAEKSEEADPDAE